MAEDVEKCEHGACKCASDEDSDYCSAYCEGAGESDITELKCECGHPACMA